MGHFRTATRDERSSGRARTRTLRVMASFDTGPMTPEAAFRLVVERAPKCAFFFDFDGTLAPIQDNPDTVQPVPGVMDTLAALRERTAKVAIVSARPVEF